MAFNDAKVLVSKQKFSELLYLPYEINWTLKLFLLVKQLRNEYLFTSY